MNGDIIDVLLKIDKEIYKVLNESGHAIFKRSESNETIEPIIKNLFEELIDIIEEEDGIFNKLNLPFYTLSLWNKELGIKEIVPLRGIDHSRKLFKHINMYSEDVFFMTKLLYENLIKKKIVIKSSDSNIKNSINDIDKILFIK